VAADDVERTADARGEQLHHQRLDLGRALRAAHRSERHLTVLGERVCVPIEVTAVEVFPVVDEELVDGLKVFQTTKMSFDRFAHVDRR